MMTRHHFEKVASLLKEFKDEIPQTTYEEIPPNPEEIM